jgi:hypothetical protein
MPDLLKSGAKAYRGGGRGLAAAAARTGAVAGIERAKRILKNPAPIGFSAAVDAAETILAASHDRHTGLRATDRQAAVARLGELVADERVPDALAVRCLRIILAATGRRLHQGSPTP